MRDLDYDFESIGFSSYRLPLMYSRWTLRPFFSLFEDAGAAPNIIEDRILYKRLQVPVKAARYAHEPRQLKP